MTLPSNRVSGFTLIELLIVITVMMLASALVGGLGIDSYRKYQEKAELLQVEDLFERYARIAFVREQKVDFEAKENFLEYRVAGQSLGRYQFEHIKFEKLQGSLNQLGVSSAKLLQVSYRQRRKDIVLPGRQ